MATLLHYGPYGPYESYENIAGHGQAVQSGLLKGGLLTLVLLWPCEATTLRISGTELMQLCIFKTSQRTWYALDME
jgi:hypothetical protein